MCIWLIFPTHVSDSVHCFCSMGSLSSLIWDTEQVKDRLRYGCVVMYGTSAMPGDIRRYAWGWKMVVTELGNRLSKWPFRLSLWQLYMYFLRLMQIFTCFVNSVSVLPKLFLVPVQMPILRRFGQVTHTIPLWPPNFLPVRNIILHVWDGWMGG